MPNIELLKDAYAIIDGIPEEAINLDRVVHRLGKKLDCGTIACAAGWLSLHPTFAAIIKPEVNTTKCYGTVCNIITWKLPHRATFSHDEAMAYLFDLPIEDANDLFHPQFGNEDHKTPKQAWLDRAYKLIKHYEAQA